jgi:UDP-2-acetamido-3-amino-2,3-dideoxy-glucuronate N-acetyltransferase
MSTTVQSHEVEVAHGALCESDDVGAGTRIWRSAHVMNGARVGAACNIGEHVFVEGGAVIGDDVTVKNGVQVWNGVTLGDGVFVGPNATFTNDRRPRASIKRPVEAYLVPTVVEDGATVGGGAVVVCGVTVGRAAMVGAGAVVTRDVPAHALVVGNPARQIGWVCSCGGPLDDALRCDACGAAHTSSGDGLRVAS